MIIDSTYMDGDLKREVDKYIGKAFGWKRRLTGEPIGSHRMMIDSHSSGFEQFFKRATGVIYANIELRPLGIIIHSNVKNTRYSWVVPYRKLSLYDTDIFSFHADGEFLKMHKDENWRMNRKFLKNLMNRRLEYIERFKMP